MSKCYGIYKSLHLNNPAYVCFAYGYMTPQGPYSFSGDYLATDFKKLYAVAEDMRSHGVPVPANILAAINPKTLQQICRETITLSNSEVSAMPAALHQQLFPQALLQGVIRYEICSVHP
uniref:Uncharacterized protein n=1 Tax=Globodera rostochiensis TaxID=31243 RepID=A0A914HUK7_GLORO